MRLKNRLFATALVVLFGVSNLSLAASFASVSAARSSSYRGGFSSQKHQSARPANSNDRSTKNTSFGSFGQQPRQSGSRSDSRMNRDLEKNQAQQQALKNFDARNRQKSGAHPEQQTSVSGKPLNPAPGAMPLPPVAAAPSVIVQRDSGSMGGALLGFMLGQAISRPHPVNSYDNGNRDVQPLASVGAVSNGLETQDEKDALTAPAKALEPESGGWTFLRLLLWLALLSALGWITYRLYRFFMPVRQTQSHYSLAQ